MILILFILLGGAAWLYFAVQYEEKEVLEAVSRGDYEIPIGDDGENIVTKDEWESVYPYTVPIFIGQTLVNASIADDLPERIQGLSKTPFLPEDVAKLFVFGVYGEHSIWMKDMNYSIDIIWATEEGEIVHIEENISPETFPKSFASPVPAWYVLEVNAGFVSKNKISISDKIQLP